MANEPLTIKVDPDSELARALKAADEPVHLDVSGVVYRVSRENEDLWAGYDPAKVRAGLRRFAGLITPSDLPRAASSTWRLSIDSSRRGSSHARRRGHPRSPAGIASPAVMLS